MKAAQKRRVVEMLVQENAASTLPSRAAKTRAPPTYPRPAVSAVQSPSAVPKV
jgi:hypothetical protein